MAARIGKQDGFHITVRPQARWRRWLPFVGTFYFQNWMPSFDITALRMEEEPSEAEYIHGRILFPRGGAQDWARFKIPTKGLARGQCKTVPLCDLFFAEPGPVQFVIDPQFVRRDKLEGKEGEDTEYQPVFSFLMRSEGQIAVSVGVVVFSVIAGWVGGNAGHFWPF